MPWAARCTSVINEADSRGRQAGHSRVRPPRSTIDPIAACDHRGAPDVNSLLRRIHTPDPFLPFAHLTDGRPLSVVEQKALETLDDHYCSTLQSVVCHASGFRTTVHCTKVARVQSAKNRQFASLLTLRFKYIPRTTSYYSRRQNRSLIVR